MKKMCMKCGGKVKMKSGGQTALSKVGVMNENLGTSGQYGFARKGGATKNAKLAAMAPPTKKITRADIITAAKKNARKRK
jgi:hypothetical protein